MSDFQIIEEKRYPINTDDTYGDLLLYWRLECRAILGHNGKRYMVMIDQLKQTIHIEEMTDDDFKLVEDDNLFHDLLEFASENGFCEVFAPMPKDISKPIKI